MANQTASSTLSLERFAPDAKSLVVGAQNLADERRHAEVLPLHLLSLALAKDPRVVEVFRRAGVDVPELSTALERALAALPRSNEPSYLAVATLELLDRAAREAERESRKDVRVEDLLNALTQEIRGRLGDVLTNFQLRPGSLRAHLSGFGALSSGAPLATGDSSTDALRSLLDASELNASPVIGRGAELRRVLSILERRSKCHPLLVGEPGVGKRSIVLALARRLAKGDVPTSLAGARLLELDSGALLAGARLRGEVEERTRQLLKRLQGGSDPTILFVRGLEQLFSSPGGGNAVGDLLHSTLERSELRLLGSTTADGLRKIQERDAPLLRLLTLLEVQEPSVEETKEIVRGVAGRFEQHHGVAIGESAIVSAAELAKRYVQDRSLPDSALDLLDESAARLRVEIDGVSPQADTQIRRLESLEAQLARARDVSDESGQRVRERLETELRERTPQVQALRQQLEARRGVVAAVRTLRAELQQAEQALALAREQKQFARVGELEHASLPELRSRIAKAEAEAQSSGVELGERVLGAEDVAGTLALWTGIPVQRMLEGEAEKLLGMEQRLSERVVGQDPAVSAIARAVRRSRVGLRDPGRPIGSFLFLGPSGVGKTELAKALAHLLFDDEHALTRLDMSEFMERHMAQRLIGAPPGYADSEQGGFLTEAVRRRPYSVLLFDEVEKAHQDVFNLLLQVLDEGRLTDGRGRSADFSNTVIIMTSNIGSDRILDTDARLFESSDGRDALRDVLLDKIREFFRPELLNRLDEVLVFRPLSKLHLRRVVDIQLARVEELLRDRDLHLDVTDAAKDRLVDLGYEPALGARPVKRSLLRHLQDPLAEALLAGRFKNGSTIRVDVDGEGVSLSPVPA